MVLDRDVDLFVAAMTGVLELFAERPETGERFEWEPGRQLTPGVEALAAMVQMGDSIQKVQVQFLVARSHGDQWVYHRGRGTLRLPVGFHLGLAARGLRQCALRNCAAPRRAL